MLTFLQIFQHEQKNAISSQIVCQVFFAFQSFFSFKKRARDGPLPSLIHLIISLSKVNRILPFPPMFEAGRVRKKVLAGLTGSAKATQSNITMSGSTVTLPLGARM